MSINIQKADECPPLPMCALSGALTDLLRTAYESDLEQPCYVTVSDTETIDVQFDAVPESFDAIASWTLRFGGSHLIVIRQNTARGPERWISSVIDWFGITVDLYAHIPVPAEAPNQWL